MNKKINRTAKYAAVFGTCAALFAGSSIAYAADFGGIRTQIETYLYGEKATVDAVKNDDNGYTFYKQTENGMEEVGGGGGIAYENGKEVPLDAAEVLETMNQMVDLKPDGSLILYDDDKTYDLSGLIENDRVYAAIEKDDETLYFDIEIAKDKSNVSWSSDRKPISEASLYTVVEPE